MLCLARRLTRRQGIPQATLSAKRRFDAAITKFITLPWCPSRRYAIRCRLLGVGTEFAQAGMGMDGL